ncbi:MAG: alpha-xylosidase [Lachnospiraceae bacterium]|nr:alpha-xylosidase [Lachnospiraceae bacterium]
MKFTEGFWLRSESANAIYAMEAYEVKEIAGGMRVLATTAPITSRGATLNLPTITIEFRAVGKNVISVKACHYQAYDGKEPRFELSEELQPVQVTITEQEAVMKSDKVTVRVNRKEWNYQFEADGKVITSCDFRNLGYMRWNKKPSTMLPKSNYMTEEYEPYMVNELSIKPGEYVYGFGERFTSFVKNGQVIDTWNEDGGTASQMSYKSIPFYMTNKGYGIFVDHSTNVSFEVASEKVEYVGFSVPGEEIRYDFIYGPSPKEIIKGYTSLTGRPALPPAWSYGLWLSTSFTTNYDEETTSSFIKGMEERQIPLNVFHFDCFWMKEFHWCDFEWDERTFPDTVGMLKRYKERGLKICTWINPYIAQGTKFFEEGVKNGYLLKRSDGRGIWQTDNWQAGMGVVDFTNPDAKKWFTEKLRTLLKMGVDCFKTDFGERIPIDVEYADGSDPVAMHNYYTFLYNQAVFQLLKEEKGESEAILFARSATVGGQQFPVHWGGDCFANYASMAETIRGGLSFAMSGFSFWSHDISGFESTAPADLYKRWVAFGLFSTHSRLHGSTSYRVPWLFDEEACDVVKFFTNLKCRLMPYIYSKSIEAHVEGTPVMRPMVFEYFNDPAVTNLEMQYMFGDRILVAPILNENSEAQYYLPDGEWTHLLSDEKKKGGHWYQETYDYFSIPLFVRENTILPIGKVEDKTDYEYANELELHIYCLQDGGNAFASIPNTKGEIVYTVNASRKGNKVTVDFSEKREDCVVILHNVKGIRDCKDCSLNEEKRAYSLLPESKKFEFEIVE